MPIRPKLDELLYQRRMTLTELSERTGVALQNLSILKTGKARAVRFSTLEAICAALDCQPGDVLEFVGPAGPELPAKGGKVMKMTTGRAAAKQAAFLLLLTPLLLLSACAAGSAAAAAAPVGQDRCAAARTVVPGLSACVETPRGLVMAGNAEEAGSLARHAAAGEERFRMHFGTPPPPYALLTSTRLEHVEAVKKLGFQAVLPWTTRSDMELMLLQAIRKSAETAARAQGIPAAQVAAVGNQAVTRSREAVLAGWRTRESGIIPHELGHIWFAGVFWPNDPPPDGRRYGTAAPDWLDEIAGILAEDERLSEERRGQFVGLYRGEAPSQRLRQIPRDRLINLAAFLEGEHPKMRSGAAVASDAAPAGDNRLSVTIRMEGSGAETTMFYLQTRMFADFLIARSGRPQIFADVARAIAGGQSFDRWLEGAARKYPLPKNRALLVADWRAWLETKIGPVRSEPSAQ